MSIKFSVLMSVYYKENPIYLSEAIDSILNQTLQASQIVIVKDGPLTPELDSIIDTYAKKDRRFSIVALKKNAGLGIALNKGMEACKYEIIARMDTDDASKADRFEKQISVIANDKNVLIVGSNIQEYSEDMTMELGLRTVPQSTEEIIDRSKTKNPFNHMSVVYRKSAVLKAGGYQDCPYFEDYYLWARIILSGGKFYNIQENLVDVRAGSSMIRRRGGFGYIRHVINFQKKLLDIKMISRYRFAWNIILRCTASIMPLRLRSALYSLVLRKSSATN